MSTLFTTRSGRFQVQVKDPDNIASWGGKTLRSAPFSISYGESARGRGKSILPSEISLLVEDTPARRLRDVFSGAFDESNYPVVVTGPSRNGLAPFKWFGFVKADKRTGPISVRQHPRKMRLVLYDRLMALRNEEIVIKNQDFDQIGRGLALANSDLNVAIYTGVRHHPGRDAKIEDVDIRSILIPKRWADDIRTYWDFLEHIGKRYQVRIYQDPYDRGENGNPRWHIMFRGAMGESVNAEEFSITVNEGLFSHEGTNPTPKDIIVTKVGEFITKQGEEMEDAGVYARVEDLPDKQADDITGLVLNGTDIQRDHNFTYNHTGTSEPLYGYVRGLVETIGSGRIQVHASDTSGDSSWTSEGFRVPSVPQFGSYFVTLENYNAPILNFGTFVDVILRLVDDDGSTLSSVTGDQNSSSLTLEISQSGIIEVEVESDGAEFTSDGIGVRLDNTTNDEDAVPELIYPSSQSSFGQRDIGPFIDVRTSKAPISRYIATHGPLFDKSRTAGEYASRMYDRLTPAGAQTMQTAVRDRLIGPRTRIEKDGDVFVIGGGRTLHTQEESTEISDIQIPDYTS